MMSPHEAEESLKGLKTHLRYGEPGTSAHVEAIDAILAEVAALRDWKDREQQAIISIGVACLNTGALSGLNTKGTVEAVQALANALERVESAILVAARKMSEGGRARVRDVLVAAGLPENDVKRIMRRA
jgi:hypothetical protein